MAITQSAIKGRLIPENLISSRMSYGVVRIVRVKGVSANIKTENGSDIVITMLNISSINGQFGDGRFKQNAVEIAKIAKIM